MALQTRRPGGTWRTPRVSMSSQSIIVPMAGGREGDPHFGQIATGFKIVHVRPPSTVARSAEWLGLPLLSVPPSTQPT
jgi:hypothetical protein